MSSLMLIRHGQASFFAKDYDRLSPLGQEQARALGRFWRQNDMTFDDLITGPRHRHRATTELALEELRAEGRTCPATREEPDFDEHQLEQLLREERKALEPHLPELGSLREPSSVSGSTVEAHRRFRRLLEVATSHWLEGGAGAAGVESWPAFRQRVSAGLARILERGGRGRRVAVVTSAGVIGAALQKALGCSDAQAMALSRRLRNASLTEFVFSGGRFTLDSFNALPHLPDRATWTYL